MGYYFTTKSGTVYTVKDTSNPQIQLLSGRGYEDNAIYRPQAMLSEGQPFHATFVPDHKNQAMGIAGRTLRTSPVASVHAVKSSHESRMVQADAIADTIRYPQDDMPSPGLHR